MKKRVKATKINLEHEKAKCQIEDLEEIIKGQHVTIREGRTSLQRIDERRDRLEEQLKFARLRVTELEGYLHSIKILSRECEYKKW